MLREFTATVYILERTQALLIYHKKMKKWLPPGGHIEENETPPEAAIREAKEETGLEIELISQENITVEYWNAKTLTRPWMCLLENIPATPKQAAHQHMDMIFLGRVKGGSLVENLQETGGAKWFSLEELNQLQPDKEIFQETLDVLQLLLAS